VERYVFSRMNSLDAFATALMEPIAWASLEINKRGASLSIRMPQ
jgi:hypothetical protein